MYRFDQHISGVKLRSLSVSGEQAGEPARASVPAWIVYSNDATIWVEPASGIIVKVSEAPLQQVVTDAGKPVFDAFNARLTVSNATVASPRKQAASASSSFRLMGTTLPLVAFTLGAVLLLAGLVLLRVEPAVRRVEPAEPHPAGSA